MSHTFLTFCKRRGRTARIGFCQRRSYGVDRVDSSPRDHQINMCVKSCLSETIDGRHVAHLGDVNLHWMDNSHRDFNTSPAIRGHFQSVGSSSDERCSSDGCDRSRFQKSRDTVWTLRRASDPHRTGEISGDWMAYLTPCGSSGALDLHQDASVK